MNRKKTEQQTKFQGDKQTWAPVIKQTVSRRPLNDSNRLKRQLPESLIYDEAQFKRPRISEDVQSNVFPCLEQAMINFLNGKIKSILQGKDVEKNLKQFEDKFSNPKTIPRGILSDTANLAGCKPSIIKQYLEKNSMKKNEVLWKDFFEKEYQNTLVQLRGLTDQEGLSHQNESTEFTKQEVHRTFSVSINKIFRSDIHDSIKEIVTEKLQESQEKSTDYIIRYSMVVNLMILKLRSCTFKTEGNSVVLSKSTGIKIADLLPSTFRKNNKFNVEYSASPPPSDLFSNKDFKKDYDNLFQNQHLQLIHSYFFGATGIKQANPVQQAFFDSLASNNLNNHQFQGIGLSDAEMGRPREQFITNLDNMWNSNGITHILVARTLEILLKIHLAPKRYACFEEMKNRQKLVLEKKKSSNSVASSLITRNQARNRIRKEYYNIKQYSKKKRIPGDLWDKQISSTYQEINKIKSLYKEAKDLRSTLRSQKITEEDDLRKDDVENTDVDLDDEEDNNTDISRRRVSILKSIVKRLLFDDKVQSHNEESLREECQDIITKEINVCLMILKTFKPYIPTKENRFILIHQLPLSILCNDILNYTSYSKHTRLLCPQVSVSQLDSLHLNAASLFQILARSSTPLVIFGYDNYMIESNEVATRNKDAVFNSIFNMKCITDICKSYKLKFAHYITLLPGLKTARVLGTKFIQDKPDSNYQNDTKKEIGRHPRVLMESQKEKDLLKEEIKVSDAKVKKLSDDLKRSVKEDRVLYYSEEIKKLKSRWMETESTDEKKKLYDTINDAKNKRDSSFVDIEQQRSQLRTEREALHYKRLALRVPKNNKVMPIDEDQKSSHKIMVNGHGIRKSEDSPCNNLIDMVDKFSFSGTDNGLKTMTTSVGFSFERFLFHLNLYCTTNYPITEFNDTTPHKGKVNLNQNQKKNLKLKAEIMNAEDIDVNSGYMKARKELEKSKINTTKGKEVERIENLLSKSSVNKTADLNEAKDFFEIQFTNRNTLRSFYNSKRRMDTLRYIELKNNQARRYLCSK